MARRIAVMGSSCAGKTTLAGQLAERLGVPHIELDALHHGPNWTEATAEELRAKLETALAPLDGWIADGNYTGKLGTYLIDQADTIVWLDLPLRTSLRRLWRRHQTRIRDRIELWNGNQETWRNAFMGWNALPVHNPCAHPAKVAVAAAIRGAERRAAPLTVGGGGVAGCAGRRLGGHFDAPRR